MPTTRPHPFLDLILPGALVPQMLQGRGHEQDPPMPDSLQPAVARRPGPHPGLAVVEMLLAADHDCREDRYPAAEANLALAETRLRLDQAAPGAADAVLAALAAARQEVAHGESRRACAAIANALRLAGTTLPPG